MSTARNILILFCVSVLMGCASTEGVRIDNIPMYGQPEIERPPQLKEADARFIEQASSGFPTREAASVAWHQQGDNYMDQGNLDYAMRRYNQAWLLDPDSYLPYWGFARVLVAKRQYDEAFEYFEKAIELADDPYQKPALLSDFAAAYHNRANRLPPGKSEERLEYFRLANAYFEESTALDPNYVNAWRKWAISLYFQGDYAGSWEKVNAARDLDPNAVPEDFLVELRAKMPEPGE